MIERKYSTLDRSNPVSQRGFVRDQGDLIDAEIVRGLLLSLTTTTPESAKYSATPLVPAKWRRSSPCVGAQKGTTVTGLALLVAQCYTCEVIA